MKPVVAIAALLLATACGGDDDGGAAETTPTLPPVLEEPQCPEAGDMITEEIRSGCYIGTQFHVVQARNFDACEVFTWGDIYGYFWGPLDTETREGQLRDRENDDVCP